MHRIAAASCKVWKGWRCRGFSLVAAGLLALIAFLSPQQLPVVILKAAIVSLGGVLGYWLDRHLFPYARPHALMNVDIELFSSAMIRRALVVGATVIALALAL